MYIHRPKARDIHKTYTQSQSHRLSHRRERESHTPKSLGSSENEKKKNYRAEYEKEVISQRQDTIGSEWEGKANSRQCERFGAIVELAIVLVAGWMCIRESDREECRAETFNMKHFSNI